MIAFASALFYRAAKIPRLSYDVAKMIHFITFVNVVNGPFTKANFASLSLCESGFTPKFQASFYISEKDRLSE